jgi:hypothetical protein
VRAQLGGARGRARADVAGEEHGCLVSGGRHPLALRRERDGQGEERGGGDGGLHAAQRTRVRVDGL